MNTAVQYARRGVPASAHPRTAVFEGEISDGERDALTRHLTPQEVYFPAWAWRASLQPGQRRRPWVRLRSDHTLVSVQLVDALPTQATNVHEFVARLLTSARPDTGKVTPPA